MLTQLSSSASFSSSSKMTAVLAAPSAFVAPSSSARLSPDLSETEQHSDAASAVSIMSYSHHTEPTNEVEFYETPSPEKQDNLMEAQQNAFASASASGASFASISVASSDRNTSTADKSFTKTLQEQPHVAPTHNTLRSFSYNDYGSIDKGSVATATTCASELTYDETHASLSSVAPLKLPYAVEIVQEGNETISGEVKVSDSKTTKYGILSWCAHQIHSPSEKAGRVLAMLAAVMYGTSFASVKVLDDTMPMAITALFRFGIGAITVTWITLHEEARGAAKAVEAGFMEEVLNKGEPLFSVAEKRRAAMWCGAEIGVWYTLGYLFQGKNKFNIVQYRLCRYMIDQFFVFRSLLFCSWKESHCIGA